MNAQEMTDTEVYKLGLEILLDKLGTAGRKRFLGQCKPGKGDYTTERHKWLDKLDMDTIINEVHELHKQEHIETAHPKPIKNVCDMTDREVYRSGLRAITGKLGHSGLVQFLRHCKSPMSLYTTDEYKWSENTEQKIRLAEKRKEDEANKDKKKE